MGSVKDISILEPAYENRTGIMGFDFSDRYSTFDWGEMPDQIKNKGRSLAVMSAYNFEELERRGIATHYRGLYSSGKDLGRFQDLVKGENGSNIMYVDSSTVYHPIIRNFVNGGNLRAEYDYSFFDANRGKINNYLIPLEIIFRNGLPKGSSVFNRIAEAKQIANKGTREKVLKGIYRKLGLENEPKPGDMLPKPVMTYSTKLEAGDRNLTEDEAYRISGLTMEEFKKVGALALKVDDFITEQAEKIGFVHYDGKVEMVFNNGLVLVDVVGTFDEDRFGFNDEQVSKEFLRQWYHKNQPEFPLACDGWKKTGEGWQERCPVKPRKLPEELSTLVSEMYMAGVNRYVERRIFNVPELEEVMEKIRPYRE